MIRLAFMVNREVFIIEIKDKVVNYRDRKFPQDIQFMPKDPNMIKKVLFSRNRIPKMMLDWINEANTGKNLEEYQGAKDDEALVPIIKKDAGNRGCIFVNRKDIEDEKI